MFRFFSGFSRIKRDIFAVRGWRLVARRALGWLPAAVILMIVSAAAMIAVSLYLRPAKRPVVVDPHAFDALPQASHVDLEYVVYVSSVPAVVKVNGLPVANVNLPVITVPDCASTPANTTLVSVARDGDACKIYFKPILDARTGTLVIYTVNATGWTSRIYVARAGGEVRTYSPSVSVDVSAIGGPAASFSGVAALRVSALALGPKAPAGPAGLPISAPGFPFLGPGQPPERWVCSKVMEPATTYMNEMKCESVPVQKQVIQTVCSVEKVPVTTQRCETYYETVQRQVCGYTYVPVEQYTCWTTYAPVTSWTCGVTWVYDEWLGDFVQKYSCWQTTTYVPTTTCGTQTVWVSQYTCNWVTELVPKTRCYTVTTYVEQQVCKDVPVTVTTTETRCYTVQTPVTTWVEKTVCGWVKP